MLILKASRIYYMTIHDIKKYFYFKIFNIIN